MNIKDILPVVIRGKGQVTRETIRQVITIQRDEFTICHPVIREVASWLGLKKKALLVHRTADGKWDVKQVPL